MQASFHIEHFGCRAARADGEAVGQHFRAAGLVEQEPAVADLVIVNTCSVTAEADRAARAFIRSAHRRNPAARIVVTGCYAQRAPAELAAMPGVAAVVGNSHKALAPEIALNLAAQPTGFIPLESLASGAAPTWVDDSFAHSFLEESLVAPQAQPAPPQVAQTRPNLKIQEGCGNRCTFCVIPQTRGPSKSLPAATILRQVEGFVAAGGKELVLSGINLGRWGRDLRRVAGDPPPTLAGLVRGILEQTSLPRLRLSSIEPMDWDGDLLALLVEFGGDHLPGSPSAGPGRWGGRLARHAHLPLQSGSDAVLARMHRRYRPWHYIQKVEALLKAAGPDLTLGADIMVGFPGETDAEFEETVALVRSLPFGYLHLFPFSPRPGTPGWALHLEQPVPPAAVAERMTALRLLGAEKSQIHRSRFIGRQLPAITLHTPSDLALRNRTSALTDNFLPVELEGALAANCLVSVLLTGISAQGNLRAVPKEIGESESSKNLEAAQAL